MRTDFEARRVLTILFIALVGFSTASNAGEPPDAAAAAVVRGRMAMEGRQFLNAEWSDAAYKGVGKFWGEPAPDPDLDPDGYARAFAERYGFHPAPFPNDGLPM